MTPRLALCDLELEAWQQGSLFGGRDRSFGEAMGLDRLGISYNVVPPGRSGCPFHNHRAEDEVFVVLKGSGVYRFGADRLAFGAGDVLAAPAGGPETAHQILNTGSEDLVYLAMSSRAPADVIEYPDSGKVMALAGRREDGRRLRFVAARSSATDYWDGEPGAL